MENVADIQCYICKEPKPPSEVALIRSSVAAGPHRYCCLHHAGVAEAKAADLAECQRQREAKIAALIKAGKSNQSARLMLRAGTPMTFAIETRHTEGNEHVHA